MPQAVDRAWPVSLSALRAAPPSVLSGSQQYTTVAMAEKLREIPFHLLPRALRGGSSAGSARPSENARSAGALAHIAALARTAAAAWAYGCACALSAPRPAPLALTHLSCPQCTKAYAPAAAALDVLALALLREAAVVALLSIRLIACR